MRLGGTQSLSVTQIFIVVVVVIVITTTTTTKYAGLGSNTCS
jgi:hypothetical protein